MKKSDITSEITEISEKKSPKKLTITKGEIFQIIQATIDCKDTDILIQRYTIIFQKLGFTVQN